MENNSNDVSAVTVASSYTGNENWTVPNETQNNTFYNDVETNYEDWDLTNNHKASNYTAQSNDDEWNEPETNNSNYPNNMNDRNYTDSYVDPESQRNRSYSNYQYNGATEFGDVDYNNENEGYRGTSRGRGRGRGRGSNRRLNDNTNGKQESVKPKSIYVPPDFEENDNLPIEAGLNFGKYDKIEVTVSGMDVPQNITSFQDSGLRPILLTNLKNYNYTTPTPIQKYSLPIIMDGRDMMASAQTGSGKTAAFVLPILHSLLSDPSELIVDGNHCEPHAVIMSPTRELAIQIGEVAYMLSKSTSIRCEIVYGGTSVYHQKQKLLRGVHIIVATPGRLIDFMNRGLISFSSVRFFVLDEADRMLDMGFQNDIEQILTNNTMVSSSERSTIMFSATLPQSVQQIATSYLKPDYISVAVGEIGGACKDVTQTILEVNKFSKKMALFNLLKETDDCQGTIVFVEQKRQADFIAAFLSEVDFPTTSIHGDREQPEREMALKDFRTKRMKILVATSVAARGLDIKGVTMVVNFDLPKTNEEYVHRIGRTGRLGNAGKAVSFFDPQVDHDMAPYLVNTLRQAEQEVPDFLLSYGSSGGYHCTTEQFNDIRTDVPVSSKYEEEEEVW